jgi:hypothetical protein
MSGRNSLPSLLEDKHVLRSSPGGKNDSNTAKASSSAVAGGQDLRHIASLSSIWLAEPNDPFASRSTTIGSKHKKKNLAATKTFLLASPGRHRYPGHFKIKAALDTTEKVSIHLYHQVA